MAHYTTSVDQAAEDLVHASDIRAIPTMIFALQDKLEQRWPGTDAESVWYIAKALRNAAAQPVIQAVWLDALQTCLDRSDQLSVTMDAATAPRGDDRAERMWHSGDLRSFGIDNQQLAFKRNLHHLITTSFGKVVAGLGDATPYKVALWRESFDYFWTATGDYVEFLENIGPNNRTRHQELLYDNFRGAPDTAEASFRATNATNTSSALVMMAAEQRNSPKALHGEELFDRMCAELTKHVGLLSGKRNISNPLIPSGDLRDPSYMQGSLVHQKNGVQTWASPAFIKAGAQYHLDPPGDCSGWTLLRVLPHRQALVERLRRRTNRGIIDKQRPLDAVRAGEIHLFIAAYILKLMWGTKIPFAPMHQRTDLLNNENVT